MAINKNLPMFRSFLKNTGASLMDLYICMHETPFKSPFPGSSSTGTS